MSLHSRDLRTVIHPPLLELTARSEITIACPYRPPGYGPKIDKKKQEDEKALIPPSERYSIRLERQEDDLLRTVLAAAQEHATPSSQRLLRDQKKLHHLYGQLLRLGFSVQCVEQCLPHMRTEMVLSDALDWCCLHIPETSLPPAFKLSRVGEEAAEEAAAADDAKSSSPEVAAKVAEREAR